MVQLAHAVIAAADKCQHFAAMWIYGHERNLGLRPGEHLGLVLGFFPFSDLYAASAKLGDFRVNHFQPIVHRLRRRTLQVWIEGGIDPHGLLV